MKPLFISLLLSISMGSIGQTTYNPVLESDLDSIFSNWDTRDGPGGIVAVMLGDEVIYKKSFGMADIDRKIPLTTDSMIPLASMAKQFTATCIALLEEQGKISREDNLKKFYPYFQFRDTIRIRHLLDHSSGIREAYVLATLSGKVNLKGELPGRYHTKKFLFKVLSQEKDLNFSPGEETVYTNINYILLGDIVEKVSSMPLRQFADSAIFLPLGMTHTFFNDEEGTYRSFGYHREKDRYIKKTIHGGIVGDHNIVSTVDDLIRWGQNFNHNELGEKDTAFIKKLCASSVLNNGEKTNYGYGLSTRTYRGQHIVYHGGDNGVHTTFMVRVPREKLTVICLSNSSSYGDTQDKAYAIVDRVLKGQLEEKKLATHQYEHKNLPIEKLKSKTGMYYMISDQGLGRFRKITLDQDTLYASSGYWWKGLKVINVDTNQFVAQNDDGHYLHFRFSQDSSGQLLLHEDFYTYEEEWIFQPLKEAQFNPDDYVGKFHNASTGATIALKRKKDGIIARKGIIKIPMIAFNKDLFFAYNHQALFMFERDVVGKVKRLIINAPDFRNFKLMRK